MAESALRIDAEELPDDDVVILRLSGRIDSRTCDDLQQTLQALFAEGHRRLVLDLSKIDYFSSAGLGIFINTSIAAKESHGNIVLMNPSKPVSTLLNLIGMHDQLSIAHDFNAALEML